MAWTRVVTMVKLRTGGELAVWLLVGLCVACGRGSLPVFKHDQTDSTHAEYRRSTITSGGAVYVNDFEEYALRLANPEPTQFVGRAPFGDAKVAAIPGQSTNAYL